MKWFELYQYIFTEFADAFENISTQVTDTGFYNDWGGGDHNLCHSFFMITSVSDIEIFTELKARCMFLISDSKIASQTVDCKYDYLSMNSSNVTNPIMMTKNFESYSFNNKNKIYKIRDMINALIKLGGISNNKSISQRYYGGIMHILNGKIITIEDDSENIYAMALIIVINQKTIVIEELLSNNYIDNEILLLEKILSEYRKYEVILVKKSSRQSYLNTYFRSNIQLFRYKF